MTGEASNSLKLTIRLSSSSRFEIGSCGSIKPGSTIRQVKDIISQREESGHCAAERQRLIYKGRILSEDSRTLADYAIGSGDSSSGEGIVLYLVKGGGVANANVPSAGAAAANATASAPASLPNSNASLNSNPFANFGNANSSSNPMASMMNMMGSSGGMPDIASIQQQLQQNPQLISDMMNNPMVQSLMSSPDFLRTMMESNPQMRQIMESNPELRLALEDPEFMRRSMQMMRDPSAMQNMMRNQDLAMSQIENMPGGYNALRRMYEDVQEPMIDALAGGGSTGTTGSGSGNNAGRGSAGNGTAGATNQAMPNPWGAPAPTPTNQAAGGVGANPFASLMGSTGGMGMPGAGAGAAHNPWANPMMGPNAPNLEATLQMMENPMMQNMMQNMMSNPETMRMMMDSNPMVQQLRQTNPQAAAVFDNPEMVRSQCFCFLEYHGHCFVSVCILPLNQDESNDGSKQHAFHGANATEYAATFRQHARNDGNTCPGSRWRIRLLESSWGWRHEKRCNSCGSYGQPLHVSIHATRSQWYRWSCRRDRWVCGTTCPRPALSTAAAESSRHGLHGPFGEYSCIIVGSWKCEPGNRNSVRESS